MTSDLNFSSQFAGNLRSFILEKRGLGCKYKAEAASLRLFDEYVGKSRCIGAGISKDLFEGWTNRRPHEREKTCENRTNILAQFCKYVVRIGGQAYIPPSSQKLRRDISYRPYIFTNEELSRFLDCAKNMSGSIQRKAVFHMLFSMLICTGLRLGEALRLRWSDIDWDCDPMMVSVVGAKFDKDRAIPVSDGLSQQLCKYREEMSLLFPGCEYLFPSRHYVPYSENQVYITFRKILWNASISHGGTGKGPRIHDFRHSFAVKSLRKMVCNKEDIMAVMPLLSQYLGHKNIYATQSYLQFTADMFPYVAETVQTALGNVVPEMEGHDEEAY
jgi:integrase